MTTAVRRIIAIVPDDSLKLFEACLREIGAPGVTVESVKGYGQHANYFQRELMWPNARIVVYTSAAKVDSIVEAITRRAREAQVPAGILVVETVDRLVDLNSGMDVTEDQL